jgi:lipopolysaccharide export system protein LptA
VGIFLCKRLPGRILTMVLLLWAGSWVVPLAAQLRDSETGVASAEPAPPVTITADELISDDTSKTAEFIGNVKVIRGHYTLTADRLKVLYKRSDQPPSADAVGRANIREIVAEGRVRIVSPDITASSERAAYDAKNRRIELSGEDATVVHDGGTVSGPKITVFLDTAQFQVSGDSENRVRAVFKTPEKK